MTAPPCSTTNPKKLNARSRSPAPSTIIPWKKHTVYLADTPGDDNFLADTRAVLHVGDAAVVVVDAVDGVKVGTEKVWHTANHYQLPRLLFINKLDRERADLPRCSTGIKDILEAQAVPLQFPIGKEAGFKGVVDLVP